MWQSEIEIRDIKMQKKKNNAQKNQSPVYHVFKRSPWIESSPNRLNGLALSCFWLRLIQVTCMLAIGMVMICYVFKSQFFFFFGQIGFIQSFSSSNLIRFINRNFGWFIKSIWKWSIYWKLFVSLCRLASGILSFTLTIIY